MSRLPALQFVVSGVGGRGRLPHTLLLCVPRASSPPSESVFLLTDPTPSSTDLPLLQTLGLVSPTIVPFTSVPLGKTTFQITTSVGRSLQTYDLKRGLNLVFITRPQTPGPISATTAWADKVAAAWSTGSERGVWIYKRGKKVAQLEAPLDANEDIVQLQVFGSWIVACCRTKIEVWSALDGEHYTTLAATNGDDDVLTGGICSMPTFVTL